MRNVLVALTLLTLMLTLLIGSPASGQTAFKAMMDEAQSGGTGSAATGAASLILNEAQDALSMTIEFDGITTSTFTAFHIHVGAVGQNGGVVFGLVSPGHDSDGDFMDNGTSFVSEWDSNDTGQPLASQLDNLMNEGLYFNGHTPANPDGEIRGQIIPVLGGDVNGDDVVSLLDVAQFVALIISGDYQIEADLNFDNAVNLLDVTPFIALLNGG